MLKVIIADDQPLIREGLKYIMEQSGEIEVAGCAANGNEAFDMCGRYMPDVVLMDIVMPECDGIDGLKTIKAKFPHVKVLILTTFKESENIVNALNLGADGYILKDIAPEDLILSVKNVSKGLKVIQDEVFKSYAARSAEQSSEAMNGARIHIELSQRETDIVRLIVYGSSNKEIAAKLGITEGSVRNIISGILNKVNCQDRTQLAVFCIKNKVV